MSSGDNIIGGGVRVGRADSRTSAATSL